LKVGRKEEPPDRVAGRQRLSLTVDVLSLPFEDPRMGLVKEFGQGQEISCSEIVRMLPLFVVVGTADGDGVERPFLALVLPNGYLQLRHSEGFYGLGFVIWHMSFSFKVKLNFGPALEAEDQVNETKGNHDLRSRRDGLR
jgi:hypothetical protein